MKQIKIMIVITVIIIIMIGAILIVHNNSNSNKDTMTVNSVEYQQTKYSEISEVSNKNNFFTINTCIQNYYSYVQEENDEIANNEQKKEIIYSLLDVKYIEDNNITKNNVLDFSIKMSYTNMYTSKKMYMKSVSSTKDIYYVQGRIIDYAGKESARSVYNIVILDKKNMTYSIVPSSEYNFNDLNTILSEYEIKSIEVNNYNTFKYNEVTQDAIVRKYFSDYMTNALYDPETAYNALDPEYKQKRFETLDNYKSYINENKEIIKNLALDKYQITNEDGYTQYVCIDMNGNYYIFRETSIMQYTLLLDTYTINIPEFTAKYKVADLEEKVGLNIGKIVAAINNRDYEYIYGKLDQGFKNNYFKSIDVFEEYVSTYFFDNNKVEYQEYKKEGDICIYSVIIKDATNKKTVGIPINIIMKLQGENDFVFSFK